MNNSNMINPANYYNPFAKYNYISRTRGVYLPKDTVVLSQNTGDKSTNIYSENYDAMLDLENAINSQNNCDAKPNIANFFKQIFL